MSVDEDRTTWPSDPTERAHALVAAGRIGGPRPGSGRPRRDRFSRLVAEGVADHVDEVVEALRRGLVSQNERTAVMAARAATDLLVRHDALEQRDEHHSVDVYARMTADEVRAEFAHHLAEMVRSGELTTGDLLTEVSIVDAEVVQP